MPPHSRLGGSRACRISSTIPSSPLLTFLCPLAYTKQSSSNPARHTSRRLGSQGYLGDGSGGNVERLFFSALTKASLCRRRPIDNINANTCLQKRSKTAERFSTYSSTKQKRAAHNEQDPISGQKAVKVQGSSKAKEQTDEPRKSIKDRDEAEAREFFPTPDRVDHDATISNPRDSGSIVEGSDQYRRTGGNRRNRYPGDSVATQEYFTSNPDNKAVSINDQLRLIRSVREMEQKLEKARSDLHKAMERTPTVVTTQRPAPWLSSASDTEEQTVVLTKADYLDLVDLYFYSHKNRFAPDSPDSSPTPIFIDDYSFRLSGDFTPPGQERPYVEEDDLDISVLKHVEEMLMSRQLREVSTMQAFVDLLLDDMSSNRALFETYRRFPEPGVAWLPPGVIRLFLQRMSTPWQKSERSMLRYLSLIDDMQRAALPITAAEWSSAIYLAGRSFARVTDAEIASSFRIWREMEQEAGVQATHVTFNILFDIAVRAGKFVLGETVLKEMYARGLRLNRLGRVSLIYYHGLRGDGDGVRKSYRDFVEAGEIVDTLVLNCVMASLINAQEPIAAEQIYERMKLLQARLQKGEREDGEEALFMKYPPPGTDRLGSEMASNSLGRILQNSARLKSVLPDHHVDLQNRMPLTPDAITFRTLISYHAGTSGDLDRLSVFMNDMTQQFNLPISTLTFQLLFRGFSIHGGSQSEDAKWTNKRLEIVWQACLAAIKETKARAPVNPQEHGQIDVPSMAEVETHLADHESRSAGVADPQSKPTPSAWDAFILDFTTVPGERLRRSGLAPTEDFSSPFFSAESQRGEKSSLHLPSDTETEDLYSLPSADETVTPPSTRKTEVSDVRPSKWLVIWLIRAYAHCTGSRIRLEEIWGTIRRVWKPADFNDRDAAVRALRHAIKQCDTRKPF